MGRLTIVGLGPGNPGHLSLEALNAMQGTSRLILRTEVHPTVELLREKGIAFESCDRFYEEGRSFDEVYRRIVDYVLGACAAGDVVFAVPGSPLVAEQTVVLLREAAAAGKVEMTVLPGMSFLDLTYNALGIDPLDGVRIIDAGDYDSLFDAGKYPLIITQVYSKAVASELKLTLMERLEDETPVFFLRNLGLPDEVCAQIPLYELDRQADINHLTSVYIPRILGPASMDMTNLISVVKVLREPGGCPWDREQDHASLRRDLVEECYELLEAIDDKDAKGMREELGDVLLQVVFHARLAEEEGSFAMQDVIDDVVTKLIHRHPHVFGTVHVDNSEEVLRNWEEIKKQEKQERKRALDGIAKGLPALMRAYKLQSKAAKVGFDWDNPQPVWDNVQEELGELREALQDGDKEKIAWEGGDLLFALVNYLRHLGVEGETALNSTNNRFANRFNHVEDCVRSSGKAWQDFSLDELDEYWKAAKKLEK